MKNILPTLLLFCFTNVFSQTNKQKLDSISNILLKQSYDLIHTKKYNESIKLSNKALEYSFKSKTDSITARAYNLIGLSLMELGDTEIAFEHINKAKNIYKKNKSTKNIIGINNNLGLFYAENKEVDSSNIYYKKAMKMAENSNKKDLIFLLSYNLGYNYGFYKNEYSKSMSYLKKSLNHIEYSDYKRVKAKLYRAIGYVQKRLNKLDSVHTYYDRSIEINKTNGYLSDLAEVYEYKIQMYNEQNDLASANNLLFELTKVKDSIHILEKEDLAKEIEAKYKLKDNNDKIKYIKKEKAVQQKLLHKSNLFNWLLAFLMVLLLFTAYWIFSRNKELKKARDKAEQLSKVKSNFYSEISHELRTPLYAVIELSSLLLKENVNIKHKEYLESLKFSGNHLLSLINNVLQLNKVESGLLKIQKSNFNLKGLISNIIDSLEYALRDNGNSIVLKYDETIPNKMVGDSLKISQVLINLISNAIKFTNNGSIEIYINRLKEKEKNGELKLFFKVKDNGLGISKEKQTQVFEDYYQEHAKNENSYKGTGLGLSIVKKTLEVIDSTIEVESEEGKGTSFFFEITFEKVKEIKIQDKAYLKQLEIIKDYKLLIVDDNKINQLVTKKVLEQLYVESNVVGSGIKAIELVKKNHYDCILMDLHMPEIDGFEASRRIREFNDIVTIIALTAASSENIEKKIADVKMNGYILKPFLTNDFVTKIVTTVESKK